MSEDLGFPGQAGRRNNNEEPSRSADRDTGIAQGRVLIREMRLPPQSQGVERRCTVNVCREVAGLWSVRGRQGHCTRILAQHGLLQVRFWWADGCDWVLRRPYLPGNVKCRWLIERQSGCEARHGDLLPIGKCKGAKLTAQQVYEQEETTLVESTKERRKMSRRW